MQRSNHCGNLRLLTAVLGTVAGSIFSIAAAQTQNPASSPASVPAGATAAPSDAALAVTKAARSVKYSDISPRQAREAEDAYLDAAKHLQHGDLEATERSLARAVELNPAKQEYVLSLAVIREHRVTELIQNAAKAHLMGKDTEADRLIGLARALDPENSIVAQHFSPVSADIPVNPDALKDSSKDSTLAPPIEFAPTLDKKSIHVRGGVQELSRAVYSAFGIQVVFDSSIGGSPQGRLDLDDVDFATATRVLGMMMHVFAVPLDPKRALVAKDTMDKENRNRLMPLVEETIYVPGASADSMRELAKLATDVFDIQKITPDTGAGSLVVRGDEDTLRVLNAAYADMLDAGSDIMLDVHLYELDKSHMRNIGEQLTTSIGGFSVVSEALNLINSNQTLIQQAIANGLLTLTGNPAVDYPKELALLLASGAVTSTQFTNILGTIGTLSGLPLVGIYATAGSTFNLLLTQSEARTLDDLQVRTSSGQKASFRAGTRFPIVTATYNSGISNGIASQLAGLNVNGTSLSSLLSQFQGTSSVSIPQIQYEDLGITLNATPRLLGDGDVSMHVEMKIEALGGGSINSIPILNNRQLTSDITIHQGQTALVASQLSKSESHTLQGLPYLSELPGFQGTDSSVEVDSSELVITITPHIVRGNNLRIASRRLALKSTPTQ